MTSTFTPADASPGADLLTHAGTVADGLQVLAKARHWDTLVTEYLSLLAE